MELSEQKLSLIEKVMRVKTQETLSRIEDFLIQAEMEARANESLDAIKDNNVVSFDEFTQNNKDWIAKKN